MARLLMLGDVEAPPASRLQWPIAAKGFRPFFLLAAVFAVLVVPLWLMIIAGSARPAAYLDPMSWHAHEMIFGFVVAVFAGFLLTAVENWTQRRTVVGAALLGLAGLWVLGRVAMLLAGSLPRGVPAIVDLAFLPSFAVAIARPIVATKNRRNYSFVAILAALFAANVVVHLGALSVLSPTAARTACLAAIDVVLLAVLVVSGRIFPMFTRNATGVTSIRSIVPLDIAAAVSMVLLTVLDVFASGSRVAAIAAGLVAFLSAARALHWGARHSFRQPLLWILHVAYAWLVVGLVLRALSGFDLRVPSSLSTHALTVGAIGLVTLGMMARVTLGHTGRLLVASKAMTVSFVAATAAATTRVFVPLVVPEVYFTSLVVAGVLWTTAFLIFIVVHVPMLLNARVDGKPG